MKCTVKTAKAYSAEYDSAAKWPEQNFTKVVKDELKKKTYDCLVMSAPTIDITNLDTSNLNQVERYINKMFLFPARICLVGEWGGEVKL